MRVIGKDDRETKRAKTGQRGAAMVETGLVFTVVLSMILFIVDMGRVLLTQQFIAERARATARQAAVNSWNSTAVANYLVYGGTVAPSGANAPGLLGLTPSEVTLTTFADSGIGDGRLQVTVQGVPLFVWVPFLAGRYNAPAIVASAPTQSLGATN